MENVGYELCEAGKLNCEVKELNLFNFVLLIDLKINKVTRKDISQMKFYIDYFNEHVKGIDDNPTIGIVLCETKDIRVETEDDIYQIKYLNEIPKEDELLKIINENKVILVKTEEFNFDK